MGFGRFTIRKKNRQQPPSLEVINTSMLPKGHLIHEVPKKEARQEKQNKQTKQKKVERPVKRKRGRPRSSANNNSHLHIKCPEDVMHAFKLLSVQERKTYPELLKTLIEAYEYVQDED